MINFYFDYKKHINLYLFYITNYIKDIYYITLYYMKYILVRPGASAFHHAWITVGFQYMFAELKGKQEREGVDLAAVSTVWDGHSIGGPRLYSTPVWRVLEAHSVDRQKAARREENAYFSFLSTNLLQGHRLPWWCKWQRICLPQRQWWGFDPWSWEDILEKERANHRTLPEKFHGQIDWGHIHRLQRIDTTEHAYAMLCCRANLPHPGVRKTWVHTAVSI